MLAGSWGSPWGYFIRRTQQFRPTTEARVTSRPRTAKIVPFLRNLPQFIPRRQIASRVRGTCALLAYR